MGGGLKIRSDWYHTLRRERCADLELPKASKVITYDVAETCENENQLKAGLKNE